MNQVFNRSCEQCGTEFSSKWVFQRFCCRACGLAATAARQRRGEPIIRACNVCNVEFVASNPRGGTPLSYCSDACRAEGLRRAKRAFEKRKRAAVRAELPARYCVDCKKRVESRRAKRCPTCASARVLEQNRASKKRTPPPVKRKRKPVRFTVGQSEPQRSFDVREHRNNLRATQLEEFITVVPTSNPLPSDPRAALIEAMERFPELRAAFAEVHGIKVGQA